MPYYELLCLASGKLTRPELKDLLMKSCRVVMQNGGVVTRLSPLGADGHGPRDLAYRIRINQVSYHTAFFYNLCAFASPTAIAEVNRILKVDERILRHLPIRRSLEAAMEPIPDIDQPPRAVSTADPNDPSFVLQKFLEEYEREFPEGTEYIASKVNEMTPSVEGGVDSKFDQNVDEVVESLRASSLKSKRKESGLSWLTSLDPDSEKDR